jgi:glycosyltransferase involved in cell wall biosynthesis
MKKTIQVILKERPNIVVAQNPSVVLATLVVMMKKVFGYRAVIDAHNSGIYPREGKSNFMMQISRRLQRLSDLTIVTNDHLRQVVESNGGRAVVLPDSLPDVPEIRPYPVTGRVNIAYICTFSADEPFREVFQAVRSLPADVVIYVTGRYNGKIDKRTIPKNVRLLGFIPDNEYWSLLSSVDFIIDLTFRENCLVCGAYEAVSLEKPVVLSNTNALITYFYKGCVYVSSSSNSIQDGIREAIEKREILYHDMLKLKEELKSSWKDRFEDFKQIVENLV